MNWKKILLGAAAGLSAGYVAFRTAEAYLAAQRVPETRSDPKAYGRIRRRLAAVGSLRTIVGTVGAVYGPAAPALVAIAGIVPVWARPGVVAGGALLASSTVELGVSFVEDYDIERRFGLTEQSPGAWLADTAKSTALAVIVSSLLATGAAAIVRAFPRIWPYLAAAALFPLLVLANVVVPLWVLPLFNKFEPLHGPLERRLRALAGRYGVGNAEILRMDMSRQTKKANAFVTGIGSTHRIVLGDTLVEHFLPEEIEFVVAHELGHYVSKDTWRSILAAEGSAALLMIAVSWFVSPTEGDDDSATLALLRAYALLSTAALLIRPALLWLSRSREWAADRFAIEATRDRSAGASAFRRLREQNLAEDDVPAWYEFFFGSHPALGKRITEIERGGNT